MPSYVEVAINLRDAENISAPQIYVDDVPMLTSFTDNGSMRASITWTLRSGNHTGKATLDWDAGKMTVSWSFRVDVFVGPGDETIVRHHYRNEFCLPVPEGANWTLQEDSDIGGEVFEIVISGPEYSGFTTNIIISSQSGSGVRETEEYLTNQFNDAIDELEASGISAIVVYSPELRTVDNHTALVALIQLEGYSVYQKIAIIASEEHETMWAIIFSINMVFYSQYNAMFELMIDGFQIEMKVPSPTETAVQAIIGIGIAAIAGGAAGALVWFARRKRMPQAPK
jgi:hypothetical protein